LPALGAATLLVVVGGGPAQAVAAAAAPRTAPAPLCRLADPRISESSGVVASSLQDDVWFTHNDSGDTARFFALDATCRTRAVYTLPGVQARDWEDIARGPGPTGAPTLWLGDIGDNDATRDQGILVHAVPEPTVPAAALAPTVRVASTPHRLLYPDGPHDAEALLADPRTGRLFVVTKTYSGQAKVFGAPLPLPDRGTLTELGTVTTRLTGTPGGPPAAGVLGELSVTGGDVSPDGSLVVLRTYTDAYLYRVPGAGPDAVAHAVTGTPTVVPLPESPQGEGIAFTRDGRELVTTSESVGAPVFRFPVPALEQPGAAAGAGPATGVAAARRSGPGGVLWPVAAGGVAVVVGAVGVGLAWRRRRALRRGAGA
jgi:hypothetical protein